MSKHPNKPCSKSIYAKTTQSATDVPIEEVSISIGVLKYYAYVHKATFTGMSHAINEKKAYIEQVCKTGKIDKSKLSALSEYLQCDESELLTNLNCEVSDIIKSKSNDELEKDKQTRNLSKTHMSNNATLIENNSKLTDRITKLETRNYILEEALKNIEQILESVLQ